MDSWQSNALFCVPKSFVGVCKIRKTLEFPTLLLVKSCLLVVDTDIRQIECLIIFPANICLFKVNYKKTTKSCEVVQS